jgi:translocation protein SEC66
MVNWIALAFPFLYLALLVGALSTFSTLYRNRKARKLHTSVPIDPCSKLLTKIPLAERARNLAPWFDNHPARDVYFSLLHQNDPADEKSRVSESLLKAALLRRAMADVQRVVEIRNTKPALAQLLQRGSIGDDLWQRFLRAESEMEEELRDVIAEVI